MLLFTTLGWSVIPYTKGLRVRFPVRVSTGGNGSTFLSYIEEPLSSPFLSVKIKTTYPWVRIKKEELQRDTTSIQKATIKKETQKNHYWQRVWMNWNPDAPPVNVSMAQWWWETARRFLQKLKIELPQDPAIPLLGVDSKELKAGPRKGTGTPAFVTALFATATACKQPECPSVEKPTVVYTHNATLFSLTKEGNSAIHYSQEEPEGLC